jgi:hypothetical protein
MARYGEISGSRKNEVGIEFRIDIQAMTKQIEKQVKNLTEKRLSKGLELGLTNFGQAILKDIEQNAPAAHLKKENRLYKVLVKGVGNYAIGIEIGAKDARAWEFGSGIHATKKEPGKYWIYARGARGEEGARLLSFDWDKSKTGRFVGVRVHHPGIPAKPYIYPALRRQLRHVNQFILQGIRSV